MRPMNFWDRSFLNLALMMAKTISKRLELACGLTTKMRLTVDKVSWQ